MKVDSAPLRKQIVEEALRNEFVRLYDIMALQRKNITALLSPDKFLAVTGKMLRDLDRMHEIDRMLREKL